MSHQDDFPRQHSVVIWRGTTAGRSDNPAEVRELHDQTSCRSGVTVKLCPTVRGLVKKLLAGCSHDLASRRPQGTSSAGRAHLLVEWKRASNPPRYLLSPIAVRCASNGEMPGLQPLLPLPVVPVRPQTLIRCMERECFFKATLCHSCPGYIRLTISRTQK